MRRHVKEGYSKIDILDAANDAYLLGQIKRTRPWSKYICHEANGSPIRWSTADRFNMLNGVAYSRSIFKSYCSMHRSLELRLEAKMDMLKVFRMAQKTDKPRLP